MFFKINGLKKFAIFTGKHPYWSLFLIKLQVFNPATSLETPTWVSACEYCEIFKNTFFIEHVYWLLLTITRLPKRYVAQIKVKI